MLDGWLDTAMRHRSSLLGIGWLLLPTAFFVSLIGTIFQHIMAEDVSFYLYLTCGLTIWAPINHILSGSASCYRANRAFLLVGGLSLVTFNLKMVFQSVVHFAIQSILIVGAMILFRPGINHEIVFSVLAFGLLLLLLFPLSVILALIGARFRDFSEALRAFVRILFLSTPVIWSVSNTGRMAAIQVFLYVNPFFFAMELIRAPLIGEPINHAYWLPLAGYTAAAWIVCIFLYRRLRATTTLWLL
ncbi:MAG: hypothetical protein KDK27_15265 [Leptospiraceae bacterium]|nr:hypothetical protein [Leptospiraceae bacterium]